jgi:DNA polymerase III epsilon subunit-like protein
MTLALVFDTETTGLPARRASGYYPITLFEAYDNARVVQAAWIVLEEGTRRVLSRKSYVIKPVGFSVPPDSTAIHGITHERAEAEGVDLGLVISAFCDDLVRCEKLVGHNVFFDANVFSSECWRHGATEVSQLIRSKRIVDTMMASHRILSLGKRPKLIELVHMLFHDPPARQLHDALDDVLLCACCYHRLRCLGYKFSKLRSVLSVPKVSFVKTYKHVSACP